jgi:hypothetical protein
LAVNIAALIKKSPNKELKFIITTHNPLFYNVLFNEFNRVGGTIKWQLEKMNENKMSQYKTIAESNNFIVLDKLHQVF